VGGARRVGGHVGRPYDGAQGARLVSKSGG
jgi:hypothetical protein